MDSLKDKYYTEPHRTFNLTRAQRSLCTLIQLGALTLVRAPAPRKRVENTCCVTFNKVIPILCLTAVLMTP